MLWTTIPYKRHATESIMPNGVKYVVVEFMSPTGFLYYRIGQQKKVPLVPFYYWSWVPRLIKTGYGHIKGVHWDCNDPKSAMQYAHGLERAEGMNKLLREMQRRFDPRVIISYKSFAK